MTEQALAIVRRHGWNAHSFQVAGDGFGRYFDGDALVGYADTGSAWVGAGAPIAEHARLFAVAEAFRRAAAEAGRRACFFGAGARFVGAAKTWHAHALGAQPIWTVPGWRARARSVRSIRAQLHRATAKGVTVRRVETSELGGLRGRTVEVLRAWLDDRRMPPMGFLVEPRPFEHLGERQLFVAERAGTIVAALGAAPIYARGGWLVETIARLPEAPNGTNELLIDAAVESAAREGASFVTLGMVPLAGGHVAPWLRAVAVLARPFYDFRGLEAFRTRLRPDAWETLYLVVPKGTSFVAALVESLRAFAGGSLVRFGLRSIARVVRRALMAGE
jgi:lysylphosphatidylglycerol synthetase-like protein (DUF2156 family)